MTLTWDDKGKMLAERVARRLFPGVWRPIDTAPKDGTVIDVWVVKTYTADTDVWNAKAGDIVGRREIDVVWQKMPVVTRLQGGWSDCGRWAHRGGYCVDHELVSVVCGWVHAVETVTHWMPQPGAPT